MSTYTPSDLIDEPAGPECIHGRVRAWVGCEDCAGDEERAACASMCLEAGCLCGALCAAEDFFGEAHLDGEDGWIIDSHDPRCPDALASRIEAGHDRAKMEEAPDGEEKRDEPMEVKLVFEETTVPRLTPHVPIKLVQAKIDGEECFVGRWSATREGERITVTANIARKERG